MDFSLLTYNTLLNDAVEGLAKICASQNPDIICLQEIDTSGGNLKRIEKLGYRLADYSNAFIKFGSIYGVATFYKTETFDFSESKIIQLPKGMGEIIAYFLRVFKSGKKTRTILRTDLICKKNGKKVVVYNIHLSAHGTNGIRLKQIQTALQDVTETDPYETTILAGDFNYPIGRKKLEELMQQYSFKEATNSILFTTEGSLAHYTLIEKTLGAPFFRLMNNELKLDYIFYKNCKSRLAKKVGVQYSDHYPVYAFFDLQ